MRCYYHRETDAIALCRHCGRGVCDACVAGLFVVLSRRMPFAMATWLLVPAALVLLIGGVLLGFTARRYDARTPSTAVRPPSA
jgi:hypothetical protein